MREYNEDDRNSKMSDLAQENDTMSRALHEIKELWICIFDMKPPYPGSAHFYKLNKQAAEIASKALRDLP